MSLAKQLLLLVSLFFFLIVAVNLVLSIGNIKSYLEIEAHSHAQDTATSLGLSLSPYMSNPNDPILKTMASAVFDMGYYQEILLTDATGKDIVRLSNVKTVAGVPDWFIASLPLLPASASSEISSGWMISGTVYVTVNTAFAYGKLYRQAQTAFVYAAESLGVSVVLLSLVLQITLKPLKNIGCLAQKITEGHFNTIERLPWTSEVRSVALSMNSMSKKLANTLEALNQKLAVMGESIRHDDASGLYKKSVFDTDLLRIQEDHRPAYLLVVKIDRLQDLVKELPAVTIDCLLRSSADLLTVLSEQYTESVVRCYRFYGGEFAMLLEIQHAEQVADIAKALSTQFAELGGRYARADIVHMGAALVNPLGSSDSVVQAAYEAYEQARLIGANSYFIRSHNDFARDISGWKALVFDCIDQANYSLTYQGQISCFVNQQLLMEEAFANVRDQQGQLTPIGPFVSIAEKYAKIIEFDKGVIDLAIAYIRNQAIQHAIAINLSTRSIKSAEFGYWLQKLFKNDADLAQRLVFAVSAYAVAKDVAAYAEFFSELQQVGGQVMIKRFDTYSLPTEMIKKLRPNFLRLSRELSEGISQSRQKQEFIEALLQLAALLDISLLAENVHDDADYQTLCAIGLTGASR
ncbi:bifunctional diguanylate cyclase/phosphodiesterase [Methylocucumis oryzae]|uniref:Signal protein n=1 Tax=Methylocucumis oryzae TaxID=1632867 RepID=A0A0F3IMU4_9GAMM|nr:LapD/MoxY N-terminal periplasmic domain-containing protein [Methylocucumis oryzae]KJV07863.1 signal protein [Methylocucumis oryzae]